MTQRASPRRIAQMPSSVRRFLRSAPPGLESASHPLKRCSMALADQPASDKPLEPRSAERLDSWKEIAAYLRRDESTVRRWEEEGLPVHRQPHKKKASVFAYK